MVLMSFLPWVMDIMDTVSTMEKPWRYIDVGSRAVGQCMRILYSAEAFMPKKGCATGGRLRLHIPSGLL